ncbi:MAG: DNA repair protein RecO [Hyphomicrobiaceae bacterium]
MQWSDEAIVLSVRPHAETSAVVELFTRNHGRHLGLVQGGRSRRLRPVLQPGNTVEATWKARLSEHLGQLALEPVKSHAATALDRPLALSGLACLTAMLRLLAERDPHPALYEVTLFVLTYLEDDEVWPPVYARWELALLDDLGFGLDLSRCTETGQTDDLIYVSPRSGRAVSAAAGEPYRDRLLRLPGFLRGTGSSVLGPGDLADALSLTGHFLSSRVAEPRGHGLPDARERLLRALAKWGPH